MKLSKSDLVVLLVLLVIASGLFWLLVSGQGQTATEPPSPSTTQSPPTTAPDNSSPYEPDQAIGLDTPLARSFTERAAEVIRLYVGYPNARGTQATLEQLRPLVDDPVLQDIAVQWQGPEVTTATAQALEIEYHSMRYIDDANSQVILQAEVTQQTTFAATPATSDVLVVNVHFQETAEDVWQIAGLGYSEEGH